MVIVYFLSPSAPWTTGLLCPPPPLGEKNKLDGRLNGCKVVKAREFLKVPFLVNSRSPRGPDGVDKVAALAIGRIKKKPLFEEGQESPEWWKRSFVDRVDSLEHQ